MNIQVDPTSSNLASAMLNSKIRPRAVVGYGVKIFHPSPPNYITRSPGYSYICPMRYSLTWCNLGRIGGSNFRSSFRRKIMYWTVMWKAVALSIFGFMPGITALKNSAAFVMRILRAQRKKALVLIYVEGITWPSGDNKLLFVCWTHQLSITKRQ